MHALTGEGFGPLLFRFAVIADTHVNPEDGRSSSPFATNALANERGSAALADIDRHDPLLVVHVGDLVHPVPELPSFEPACERFREITSSLRAPLYLTAGNHDVGDKAVDWMPAGTVTQAAVDNYRRLFGPDFHSFDAAGCHFIVIDAQVINSGLPAEDEQRAWLEEDFARNRGRRTFFFTHYPPFVSDRHEASTYDNIDEPGRSWLLDLLQRYRPEALFAGHVHHQWYDIFEGTECYILPSTAFVRQDYTELFRLPPGGPEHGRDESPKLGWYLVDVHEHGHVAHFMRTDGRLDTAAPAGTQLPPVHSRTNLHAPAGVDLRHPWVEWMDIAATGGVQEFERKRTRNDYPLVALWEAGVRRLRVPLQDLLDAQVRSRMSLLCRLGHRFCAYVFGVPGGAATAALHEHRALVETLEVVLPWRDAQAALPRLARLRADLGLRVLLSKLRLHEDAKYDGSTFNHFINHGFVAAEVEQMQVLLALPGARAAVDGFVMRIPRGQHPSDGIAQAKRLAAALDAAIVPHVRLAGDDPATPLFDEQANGSRVAEAMFCALAGAGTELFFDSFVDVDRGYFPHGGFVDRRFDPRLAARVMRHLHGAFATEAADLHGTGEAGDAATCEDETGRWLCLQAAATRWLLLLPASPSMPLAALAGRLPPALAGNAHAAAVIDLGNGTLSAPDAPGLLQGPALVRLDRD